MVERDLPHPAAFVSKTLKMLITHRGLKAWSFFGEAGGASCA